MSRDGKEKKLFDYSRVKSHWFYPLAMWACRWFLAKPLYRIEYIGTENVPKNGGFILAANHISALDPVFVGTSRTCEIHAMSKEEIFHQPFARFWVTRLNAFPIRRGSGDKTSLEFAVRVVKEGKVLGIFPEGTRSKDYRPHQAKAGVALIAKAAQADVLPVAIYSGGEKVRPFRTKVVIRFGEMIPYEELGLTEGKSSELRAAAKRIMGRITQLWEEEDCKRRSR